MKVYKFQVKDLSPLARFVHGLQDQGVLQLGQRKLFFFHGTPCPEANLRQLVKYKQFLSNKDFDLACCYGARFPQWVQERFIHPELVVDAPLCVKITDVENRVFSVWADEAYDA